MSTAAGASSSNEDAAAIKTITKDRALELATLVRADRPGTDRSGPAVGTRAAAQRDVAGVAPAVHRRHPRYGVGTARIRQGGLRPADPSGLRQSTRHDPRRHLRDAAGFGDGLGCAHD